MEYKINRYQVPCDLNVYEFDNYIQNMRQEKQKREKFLLEKSSFVKKTSSTNELLEDLNHEYEKYILDLLEERQREKKAMETINHYIERIIIEGKITAEDLESYKNQNKEIIEEIKKIIVEINKLNEIKK